MKKKLISILLASAMLFGVACTKKDPTTEAPTTVETTTKKTRPVVESSTTEPTTSADFRNSFDGLAGDFIDLCRKNDYDIALQEYRFNYLEGIDEPVRALNASAENGALSYQCIVFENPATAEAWCLAMHDLADGITKEDQGKTTTGCSFLGIWSDTDDLDSMSLYFVMGNTFVSLCARDDNPDHHRIVEKDYQDLTGKELKVSTI
ncbi:MAG: hypothetical protein IKD90_12755 [Clostridiales bacterium]|nr:hypothetical protein [Clostridiales bacterium]